MPRNQKVRRRDLPLGDALQPTIDRLKELPPGQATRC